MTDIESRVSQLEAQLAALQRQVGTPTGRAARSDFYRGPVDPPADVAAAWERFLDLTETDRAIISADLGFLAKVAPLGVVADTVVLAVPDAAVKTVIETRLHEAFVRNMSTVHGRPVRIAVTIAEPRPTGQVIPLDLRHAGPFPSSAEVLSAAQRHADTMRGFLIDEPDDDDGLGGVLAKIS